MDTIPYGYFVIHFDFLDERYGLCLLTIYQSCSFRVNYFLGDLFLSGNKFKSQQAHLGTHTVFLSIHIYSYYSIYERLIINNMQLKLNQPLAVFDLETTGTNISQDRIVEISIVKIMPDGDEIIKTRRINPTIPIPAESSMVHGIYDKDVKDESTFKEVSKSMSDFLEGCDLGGFNCLKFDIPLLVEEFLRAGVEFETRNRKFVDAQKIFHMMEKRTLSAAYKFYCKKSLDDAHSAEADTLATWDVIKAQVDRYNGQNAVDNMGNKLGKITPDIKDLHELSAANMVDLAGRFILNSDGIEVFNFGKHKHKPVAEILKTEKGYYDWMMKGDFSLDTKRKLTEIKLRGFSS